jgi:precorrin-6A/cobalt-precorrin-6A reductase
MSVLVLAGTGEARALLQRHEGADVIASLAGVTRSPKPYSVPVRTGGFGGAEGFIAYVQGAGIRAVLDMTHPYAARMPARTARLCQALALPYLRYLRAPWIPHPGEVWHSFDTGADLDRLLPAQACVFLATGGNSLDAYTAINDRILWARRVDPAGPPPWPMGGYVIGLPADNVASEVALLQKYAITHLVAKNSGGDQGRAKLEAARRLGLPVCLRSRPPPVDAPTTQEIADADLWLRRYL